MPENPIQKTPEIIQDKIPKIVVLHDQLNSEIVVQMLGIYQEKFGVVISPSDMKHFISVVLWEMSDNPNAVGYAELRIGARIGEFYNPHSKFRARRVMVVDMNTPIPENEDDVELIYAVYFYFDPNLDTSIPREANALEQAIELREQFKIKTGKKLLELGVGITESDQIRII